MTLLADLPSAHAQVTRFVNAEYGNDLFDGKSGAPAPFGYTVGPYRSVRRALTDPMILMAPPPGSLHTVRVAGRYKPGGGAPYYTYDEALEAYSTGPLVVPRGVQILYDAQWSSPDGNGILSPVIFESGACGSGPSMFSFAATTTEPSSRIDGSYSDAAERKIIIRGAGNPAQTSDAAVVIQPNGAGPSNSMIGNGHFRGIRFEDNEIGILALTTASTAGTARLTSVDVEDCEFTATAGCSFQGQAHILVQADVNNVVSLGHAAMVNIRNSTFHVEAGVTANRYNAAVWLIGRGFDGVSAVGPCGVPTSPADVTATIENCFFDGRATVSDPPGIDFGILATGLMAFGGVNLTVQGCQIEDFGGSGIWYLQHWRGTGVLTTNNTKIRRCGQGQVVVPNYGTQGTPPRPRPTSLGGFMNPGPGLQQELDSGLVFISHEHGGCATFPGYGNLQTTASLQNLLIEESGRHGILVLNRYDPRSPGASTPRQGSLLNLDIFNCELKSNGHVESGGTRVGNGLAVVFEQGRLSSTSIIRANKIHRNSLHGMEVIAEPVQSFPNEWDIRLEGTIVNNVVYRNQGDAQNPAFGLRMALNDWTYPGVVKSLLAVSQNTFSGHDWESVVIDKYIPGTSPPVMSFGDDTLFTFHGNLAKGTRANATVEYKGFVGYPLARIDQNVGLFDDANLIAGCNDDGSAFYVPVHFQNESNDDYQLVDNGANPAIDRVGSAPGQQIPGQQILDAAGATRAVNKGRMNCGTGDESDSGAYEKQ